MVLLRLPLLRLPLLRLPLLRLPLRMRIFFDPYSRALTYAA
jgi:hypothetical protein